MRSHAALNSGVSNQSSNSDVSISCSLAISSSVCPGRTAFNRLTCWSDKISELRDTQPPFCDEYYCFRRGALLQYPLILALRACLVTFERDAAMRGGISSEMS